MPNWRNWIARKTSNLEVPSSSLGFGFNFKTFIEEIKY